MTQNTKKRIIKQAIACIAQNSNAGLDEIALAAGVGRATLYRHFKSRAELLVELKLSAGDQLQEVAGPVFASSRPALEKLARIISLMVPLGASLNVSSYFCNPIKNEEDARVSARYEKFMGKVRQLCRDLKAQNAVGKAIPMVWLETSLTSLIFAAWEKVESGDIAPKQAPWLVLETFLSGHGTGETLHWLNELKEENL